MVSPCENQLKGYAYVVRTSDESTVYPTKCNVKINMNNWDNADFNLDNNDSGYTLNNTVNIYFARIESPGSLVFSGEIVTKQTDSEGKSSNDYTFKAYGPIFDLKKRVCNAIPKQYTVDSAIISNIMSYSILPYTITWSGGDTLWYNGNQPMYVSEALLNFCKDSSISYYWDYTLSKIKFFKGDVSTYSTSIPFIISKDRVEDISALANYVSLYVTSYLAYPKESMTTSTSGWYVRYKNNTAGTIWTIGGLYASTFHSYVGTFNLRTTAWTMRPDTETNVRDMFIFAQLPKSETLAISSNLKVNAIIQWLCVHKDFVLGLAGPPNAGCRIYLTDSNPVNWADGHSSVTPSGNYVYKQFDIEAFAVGTYPVYSCDASINWNINSDFITDKLGGLLSSTADPQQTPYTFVGNLGTISWIAINIIQPPGIQPLPLVYPIVNNPCIAIGGVWLTKSGVFMGSVNDSVAQWGRRDYIANDPIYQEGDSLQLSTRIAKILSEIYKQEYSIRDMMTEGTICNIGGRYTFTMDDEVRDYQIKEITYNFDGDDWKNRLALASSSVKNPISDRVHKLSDISKEVSNLKRALAFDEARGDMLLTDIYRVGPLSTQILNDLSGNLNINQLNIDVESGGSLNINKINSIGEMHCTTAYISTIDDIITMNVETAYITNLSDLANLNAISASINTINNVNQLNATNASISTISDVNQLSAITAHINTIDSVNQFNADIVYIGTIGSVGQLNATNCSFDSIGSVGVLVAFGGSLANVVLNNSTLDNVILNVGTLDNFYINNSTIDNLNLNAVTISTLTLTGNLIGNAVISAGNIQDFAIGENQIANGIINYNKLVTNVSGAENFVDYSNFEEGGTIWKRFWTSDDNNTTVSSDKAYFGSMSLRQVTYSEGSGDPEWSHHYEYTKKSFITGYGASGSSIKLEPNSAYMFSAYVYLHKQTGIGTGVAWAKLVLEDSYSTFVDSSSIAILDSWQRVRMGFISPSEGSTVSILLYSYSSLDSSVYYAYWDGVMLEKVGSTFNVYPSEYRSSGGLEYIYSGSQIGMIDLSVSKIIAAAGSITNMTINAGSIGNLYVWSYGSINNFALTSGTIGLLNVNNNAYINYASITSALIPSLVVNNYSSFSWTRINSGQVNYLNINDIGYFNTVSMTSGTIGSVYVTGSGSMNIVNITSATLQSAYINALTGNFEINSDNIAELAINFNNFSSNVKSNLGKVWEAENLSYGSGGAKVADTLASNGTIVRCGATGSDPDYFVYGPYETLPPGDYWAYFKLRCIPNTMLETDIARINVYDYTSDVILTDRTLTMQDFYLRGVGNSFTSWILFVPNVLPGHSIETRVMKYNIASTTLDVDYTRLVPGGEIVDTGVLAPTFKIGSENIQDLAITESLIGNLQVTTGKINNFAIDNSKIATFTIEYNRLVIPPIGWNHIVNSGFEYGNWEVNGSTFEVSSDTSYGGSKSLKYKNSSPGYNWVRSNLVDVRDSATIVVSGRMKGTVTSGQVDIVVYKYDGGATEGENHLLGEVGTIVAGNPLANWTLVSATLNTDASYPQVRVLCHSTNGSGTVYFDNISLTKGNQYTSYVDTTTAKDRWMPDFFKNSEATEAAFGLSANQPLCTLQVALDYKARAILFAGCDLKWGFDVNDNTFEAGVYMGAATIFTRVMTGGKTLYPGSIRIAIADAFPELYFVWTHYQYGNATYIEETTLQPGVSTIILYATPFFVSPPIDNTYFWSSNRYIRIICGSYFDIT